MRRLLILLTFVALIPSICVLAIASWSFHRSTFWNGSALDQRWLCAYAANGAITLYFVSTCQPPSCASRSGLIFWKAIQSEHTFKQQQLKRYKVAEVAKEKLSEYREEAAESQGRRQRWITQEIPATLRKNTVLGCYLKCSLKPNIEVVAYCPFWLATLPTAAFSTLLWLQIRRRSKPGHCPNCHYNLTANTSGVCPECGTATMENYTA